MRKFIATLFMLASLSVGFIAAAAPAAAEDSMYDKGSVSVWSFRGEFKFDVNVYPSLKNCFFFYPNSYVEFDAKNGAYFQLETPLFNRTTDVNDSFGRSLLGIGGGSRSLDDFTVKFYAPDGTLLYTAEDVRSNCVYSFPRADNNYENVKVRIESRAVQNQDVKFFVWVPVKPVEAKPIVE